MKAIKAILWYLAGFIIVPVLCLITPKGATKWRYLDSVYGNRYDSIDGDTAYKAKVTLFRRFRWSQSHNAPIIAKMDALDLKRIRPLAEGDTAYLATLNTQIAALRATLK